MTLTGATVFIGVATSVLAVGSLVAAAFAIAAYFGQREQVRAIRHQVEDQEEVNRKQADEQRRSQAAKVTAWLCRTEDESWKACIRNASDEPVFDVLTSFHAIQKKPGEGWESFGQEEVPRDEIICVFPPSTDRSVVVPEKVRALLQKVNHQELTDRTCVVSITFTDAGERRWQRDPRGALVLLT